MNYDTERNKGYPGMDGVLVQFSNEWGGPFYCVFYARDICILSQNEQKCCATLLDDMVPAHSYMDIQYCIFKFKRLAKIHHFGDVMLHLMSLFIYLYIIVSQK